MGVLFIILGIVGMIVNANEWFIVPEAGILICFVVGILYILFNFLVVGSVTRRSF